MNFYDKIKLFAQTARKNFYDIFFGMNEILTVVNKHILKTNGEISEIKIEEIRNKQAVAVTAKAMMKIVNNSEVSVTLINPKYFEQADVKYFAAAKEDGGGRYSNLLSSPYPKNPSANKNLSELAETLRENRSPENLLITLEPAEKFYWDEDIYFEFHAADTKRLWQGVSWKEFRSGGNSYWFWFEYRLPEAMSSLKPKLFEVFPDAWKDAGEIPIARYQIKDIFGQKFSLETKPVFIDFTSAEMKESKGNDERKFS